MLSDSPKKQLKALESVKALTASARARRSMMSLAGVMRKEAVARLVVEFEDISARGGKMEESANSVAKSPVSGGL